MPTTSRRPSLMSFVAIGLFAGLFAGFFGVGGGIIVVPLLIFLVAFDQRTASITSLAAIIPTSLVAATTFLLSGTVPLDQAAFGLMIAVGSTLTAPVGTWALRTWNTVVVRWVFIAVLLVAAIEIFLVLPNRNSHLEWSVWTVLGLIATGALMGFASGLLGIGGGILVLPILVVGFGVSDLTAKALSLIAMLPAAISGTISSERAGDVDWRAGLSLGCAMSITSVLGVWLATITPVEWASPLLAALIAVAVVQLTVRTVQTMRQS